jgi:flagellar basal-body rod modification protein FlgD
MTTVSSTTGTSGTTAGTTSSSTNAYNNLTESDFMKLLTTQLSNQDPTSPVDDTQMLAQLAQFSNLAATDQTNTDLTTISGQISTATGTPGLASSTATSGTTSTSGTMA